MASNPTPEFRAEVVRVALTSGLPRRQVAVDFGVGFSTLSRWIQQDRRWKLSSKRSRPSCCGNAPGAHVATLKSPSSNTSTGSTTHDGGTQHSAEKAPWPSKQRLRK